MLSDILGIWINIMDNRCKEEISFENDHYKVVGYCNREGYNSKFVGYGIEFNNKIFVSYKYIKERKQGGFIIFRLEGNGMHMKTLDENGNTIFEGDYIKEK